MESNPDSSGTQVAARCILIVDDHQDMRETLAEVLECAGYTVATAANGLDALNYLHAHDCPAVILLDLLMPVMDGREFRTRQQQDPDLAGIPVIVVSGADAIEQRTGSLAAAAYFTKPVDVPSLMRTIIRYCG